MNTILQIEMAQRHILRAIATLNQIEGYPNFVLQQCDRLSQVESSLERAIKLERGKGE